MILFSHPKDFTPVCTTELGEVAKLKPEFDKRNVKAIALSVDDVDSHNGWVGDILETQGTALNYPIIADPDKKVSDLYDMIHPNANAMVTVRSVFIIDPNKKLRLTITYPPSTGRNFDEILRVCRVFVGLGISRVRLTGGEPLVRARIDELAENIGQISGLDDLSVSTNGTQLQRYSS